MRYCLLLLSATLLLAALPALAQPPGGTSFKIEQEPVETYTVDEGGKQVRYVKVRFSVTQASTAADAGGKTFKILIEENGKPVREVDVPRTQEFQDLSVVL